eukprot:scaffold157980_cov23-Cyclotella_meneghiniana.AAC.1
MDHEPLKTVQEKGRNNIERLPDWLDKMVSLIQYSKTRQNTIMKFKSPITLITFFLLGLSVVNCEQCGTQAGGAVCPSGLCCSQYGWCGT